MVVVFAVVVIAVLVVVVVVVVVGMVVVVVLVVGVEVGVGGGVGVVVEAYGVWVMTGTFLLPASSLPQPCRVSSRAVFRPCYLYR